MNREEFMKNFTNVLQTEEVLTEDTVLEDLEEWDSLSKMATLAFFDKELGTKISFTEVGEFKTVKDVINKAGM